MFSIQKILLPVEFSERCFGAARHLAHPLARHFNAEITILHVMSPYYDFGTAELASPSPKDFIAHKQAQARQNLETFLSEEFRTERVKRVLLEGDPARTISEYAQAEHSDLILMPTHGYGPFRRLLLGSVTSKVLHDSNIPVLTAAHTTNPASSESIEVKHVLCAIDLGAHSAQALDWASRFAADFGAKLTLVHVITSLDPRTEEYYFAPEWRSYVMDKARTDLQQLQSNVGTHAEVDLEMGEVAKSVCFVAANRRADLLVIGRGSTAGVLGRFRTNAYAIIRESPCPVVSV